MCAKVLEAEEEHEKRSLLQALALIQLNKNCVKKNKKICKRMAFKKQKNLTKLKI